MGDLENKAIPCTECGREKYFEGLCWNCKAKKQREKYETMSKDEIEKMIDNIILEIQEKGDLDKRYEDFNSLLAYQNINTEKIAQIAFEKNLFFPYTLYLNASQNVVEGLINLLQNPNCNNANNILCCLAINGSKKVKETFFQLEKHPLDWRKKLYVDPSVYAETGGWSFDKDENIQSLIYPHCYVLQKEDRKDNAVVVGKKREEKCLVCGCNLVDILTIDGTDERLSFLNLKGKVKFTICPNCASMCEKIVMRYNIDGETSMEIIEPFEEENYLAEDMKNIENNGLKLSLEEVGIYYSHGNDEVCTIGGQADWIQDAQYEKCPDCGKKMKFLSALIWDKIFNTSMEGTLYIEHCPDCKTAVAFHQQT